MLQILINKISFKIKTKSFGISYHNHVFFQDYNDLMVVNFLLILLCWYKTYSICLISFFSLFELFPAFICANNIWSLVNNLFGVKLFNNVSVFFLVRGFNLTLSLTIVSSGSNFSSTSSLFSFSSSSSTKSKSIDNSWSAISTFILSFLSFF